MRPWIVQMHGVVDDWGTATMPQQGAGVVMFRAGSWGESWLFSDGVKMTLDIFGFSDWSLSPMVQKGPCFPTQRHLHARQWTITSCEEYICITGCYGHHENHALPHPPLTSTLWRTWTFGASSSKRSMRVGVHVQFMSRQQLQEVILTSCTTSSTNSPKTQAMQEAATKWGVWC